MLYEKGTMFDLKLNLLIPDPEQPRKFFDEQALAELSVLVKRTCPLILSQVHKS